jgi:hypothetical protein
MIAGWKKVPGMPIFWNSQHREYVAIKSDPNASVSWVERSMPVGGGIVRQNISPYYINDEAPVGEEARIRRSDFIEFNSEPGSFDDAARFAFNYMKKVSRRT